MDSFEAIQLFINILNLFVHSFVVYILFDKKYLYNNMYRGIILTSAFERIFYSLAFFSTFCIVDDIKFVAIEVL